MVTQDDTFSYPRWRRRTAWVPLAVVGTQLFGGAVILLAVGQHRDAAFVAAGATLIVGKLLIEHMEIAKVARITPDGIEAQTLVGRRRITWSDVRRVEDFVKTAWAAERLRIVRVVGNSGRTISINSRIDRADDLFSHIFAHAGERKVGPPTAFSKIWHWMS